MKLTIHPQNIAREGKVSTEKFQATTVTKANHSLRITTNSQKLLITSAYGPLLHSIKSTDYKNLIAKHDSRLIMGGDFNATSTYWGCRLNTPKGN